MSLLAPRAEPKSLSSTARTTGKKTARLMAAAGFGFGCLFPLVGTLVEATRNGDSSFEGVLAAQLNTPLLWILDVVPFLLAALCAFIAAPVRSVGNARAGRQLAALLTALVLVPLALLLLALRQDVDSANVLGQINTAGELRARSLWIERAARTNQGDWRQSLRAMGNDIAALRRSYPEEVAEIDSSWRAFHSALTKQNRVSWAQADEMRRATNILTNAIERRAQNRSRAVSTLLLLGMLSLMLGLLKCFDVLRQLRIAENELAESEDRLQRLSEAAFEGIIITENGVILTANARMAAMFGYHVADLIGMPIIKLIAPQSREIVQRAYEEQSETPYSGWGLRRNGTIF